jgi:DNA mismatch repair protein MutL
MNDILILPPHEAMKIAAGEVIERPANIIKELLENSIDAQATEITIYLKQAGKSQIIITDNGTGMTAENARRSFLPHATSKISSVNDLDTITTFGFRGEALATIAAVSRVTMTTRDRSHDTAIKITLENGQIITSETAAHQVGTTIDITLLFATIPARKKFLKTDETELNAIVTIFQSVVLLQPHIHCKLYHNSSLLYNCPPTKDHTDRAAQLWGPQLAESLIQIPETKSGDLVIFGSTTQTSYQRYNRNQIFTFVNGRWIKNSTLAQAILKGYKQILPPQKYPAAFIFIRLPQDQIDVNIHPKKLEIRFLKPRTVEQLIEKTISNALTNFVSEQMAVANEAQTPAAPESVNRTRPFNAAAFSSSFVSPFGTFTPVKPKMFSEPFAETAVGDQQSPAERPQTIFEQQAATLEVEEQASLESDAAIIGQYHKTYILIEKNGSLIMVDQHAAHERIIYESLVEKYEKIETITLLFPHVVQLSQEQIELVEPQFNLLLEHGIAAERFSESEIIIQQTPVYLKTHSLTFFIRDLIDWIAKEKQFNAEQIHAHLRATIACRSSYQAGDILNHEQMHNLIKTLQKTTNNSCCPHGRPTIWVLSKKEIDRQFKRDYQSQRSTVNDFM